jgi:Zn-dependent protease
VALTMVLAMVPSVIFHEVAHAYSADAFGDSTARRAGRVSLNPLRHIDPVGSLLVPGLMVLFVPFVIAWAKPVPVFQGNLRNPRLHSLYVALAGPASNFALAGLAIGANQVLRPASGSWPALLLGLFMVVNVLLGVLNLLPIPPLDGSAIIEFFLPQHHLVRWHRIRPLMVFPLFGLLFVGRGLFEPVINWAVDLWQSQS